MNREFARRLVHADDAVGSRSSADFQEQRRPDSADRGGRGRWKVFFSYRKSRTSGVLPHHTGSDGSYLVHRSDAAGFFGCGCDRNGGDPSKSHPRSGPCHPCSGMRVRGKSAGIDVLCFPGGDGCPRSVWRVWIAALDYRNLRPGLVHREQAATRAEHSCRSGCAGETDSLGRARPHDDSAGQRLLIGMVLGVATSRVLSAIVYQATAQDPLVLAAVALTLGITGSLSVAGPVQARSAHRSRQRVAGAMNYETDVLIASRAGELRRRLEYRA